MAGISGAGGGDAPMLATGRGLLSPLARAQYSALAWLRWRVFVNGLRSNLGAFEFGARVVAYIVYCVMGLGIGTGAGAVAYVISEPGKWQYFSIEFWVVCLLWQAVPIMLASFQEQFDLGSVLRFPVSFRSFFLLFVVFGLSDVSTILGGLCCLGIFVGVTVARPELAAWTILILAFFAVFNILLVRAIFAWIDRWLAQRRTREILGALFMVLILTPQLLNPMVWQRGSRGPGNHGQNGHAVQQMLAKPWVRTAEVAQAWLPPGLAGTALGEAAGGRPVPALGALGVLGLFVLGAGSVLGLRLRAEYRGENLGAAPACKKAVPAAKSAPAIEAAAAGVGDAGSRLTGTIAAIMEKEMRGLLRTLPLLYAVGAPLLMVLVISAGLFHGTARSPIPPFAFPLCVFFAQIGFRQLFDNCLGAEGPGVQLYFLSPTPIRTVLLAKNLFHSAVFAVAMILAGVLATVRLGQPSDLMLAITVAWNLFVLPASLATGDLISLTMPYRVNAGRISRQRGSQANGLLGLAVQMGLLGVGAAVYALCLLGDVLWVTVPVYLVLALVAGLVWMRILRNSDSIANQRKESLVATLMKAE